MFDRYIVTLHSLRMDKQSVRRMLQSESYKARCAKAARFAAEIESMRIMSHYLSIVTASKKFGVHIEDVDYVQKIGGIKNVTMD